MDIENEVVLTAGGLKKIEDELEHLRTVHRREVADRIRDSKQFGELAENAEYEDAKMEQAFIEGRILDLKRILHSAIVICEDEVQTDSVGIGSKVKVKELGIKEKWEFTIVGSVEADPLEDRVSNESPVGEALMEHKVGDTVEVHTPEGPTKYKIISISK